MAAHEPLTFRAATLPEAYRRVRERLGDDAIVSKEIEVMGGYEVIAYPSSFSGSGLQALRQERLTPPSTAAYAPVSAYDGPHPLDHLDQPMESEPVLYGRHGQAMSLAAQTQTQAQAEPQRFDATPRRVPMPEPVPSAQAPKLQQMVQAPASSIASSQRDSDAMMQTVLEELRVLRGLVASQSAGVTATATAQGGELPVAHHLLACGFSHQLVSALLRTLPKGLDYRSALEWVKTSLVRQFQSSLTGKDLVEQGGVYALVGPTGVGKTTTVAKIAARAALTCGAAKVALLTTDSYRIGAQDQLRIYGNIIGVSVEVVRDETDLKHSLEKLEERYLVLIDTVGMSQKDKHLAHQAAMLAGSHRRTRSVLLLPATIQGNLLEEVVNAYQSPELVGSILTKTDEALSLAPVLDVTLRHRLPVHYIANGQRVPEDLSLPRLEPLIARALELPKTDAPFGFQGSEHLLGQMRHSPEKGLWAE